MKIPNCEVCGSKGNGINFYNCWLCGKSECLEKAERNFKKAKLMEDKELLKEVIREVMNDA